MPEDCDAVLKLYRDTRAVLLEWIDGIPEAMMVEPLIDGWSVKDHLVHITAWDELRALEVERISRGHQTAWRMDNAQGDAYSTMVRALRSGHSLAQVLDELAWSRERLIAAITAATPEGLDASRYGEAGLVSHHELAHAGWINNWRKRAGL